MEVEDRCGRFMVCNQNGDETMLGAQRSLTGTAMTALLVALAVAATAAAGAAAPPAGPGLGRVTPVRAAWQDAFPTMAGEAMRYYEGLEDWLDGPVEYLLMDDEYDIWDELETPEQRQAFVEWFWARRDDDTRREGNPFKEQFYENVATANQRLRGFPRGWKSDRGRVWCTLGRPNSMSRRTWGDIYGGMGPDFEVWGYYTLGQSRGFAARGGEFPVYFLEVNPGRYEIWDFGFRTSGSWDRNIRMAFEYANEFALKDSTLEFEPDTSERAFLREVVEGTLPIEVFLGDWGPPGAGGTVAIPVTVRLGDLLFQPEEDNFIADVNVEITLYPEGSGDQATKLQSWKIVLQQEQLMGVGSGSVHAAAVVSASPGSYEVQVTVFHPLAASEAVWRQSIEVTAEPAAGLAVGKLLLPLDAGDASAVAVVETVGRAISVGDEIVIGAWVRGAGPDPQAVSLVLVGRGGAEHPLGLGASRWLGGIAGPLVVDARVPELPPGMYRLRVGFGGSLDEASIEIEVEG